MKRKILAVFIVWTCSLSAESSVIFIKSLENMRADPGGALTLEVRYKVNLEGSGERQLGVSSYWQAKKGDSTEWKLINRFVSASYHDKEHFDYDSGIMTMWMTIDPVTVDMDGYEFRLHVLGGSSTADSQMRLTVGGTMASAPRDRLRSTSVSAQEPQVSVTKPAPAANQASQPAQKDDLDPKLKLLHDIIQKGQLAASDGDYKAAVDAYNEAEPIYPAEAEREVLFYERGKAKGELKDFAGALADFAKALELRPEFPQVLIARGRVLAEMGNKIDAMKDLDRAIALDPKNPAGYDQRGYERLVSGRYALAVQDFDRSINLAPGNERSFLRRATAQRLLGNTRAVIADCDAVLKIAPEATGVHHLRARARFQIGDLDGALADSKEAIDGGDDDDDNLELSVIRGFANARKGNTKEAVELLMTADTPPRSRPYAHYRVWIASAGGGEREAATRDLREYIRSGDPALDDWLKAVGQLLVGERNEERLIELAESASANARNGRLAEAWFYSGILRRINQDPAGALTNFRRCIATGRTASFEYMLAESELAHMGQRWGPIEQARYAKYADWLKTQAGLPRYKHGGPLIKDEDPGSPPQRFALAAGTPVTVQSVNAKLGRAHDQYHPGLATAYVAADLLTNKLNLRVSAADLAITCFMYLPRGASEFSAFKSTGSVMQVIECSAGAGYCSEADIRSDWLWNEYRSLSGMIKTLETIASNTGNPEEADELSRQITWTFFPELQGPAVAAVLLTKPKAEYFPWLAFLEASGRRQSLPELHYVAINVRDLTNHAGVTRIIDRELDSGNVISVSYGSTSATLVGAREDGVGRAYLLRHPFRLGKQDADLGASIDPSDAHYLWVSDAWLSGHVTEVCYLR